MSEKIITPESRDRQAEFMFRFLDLAKNIKPFEGRNIEEVLRDEENRRALVERIDANEFIELINGVNGILRDKDKSDWTMDGKKVFLTGFIEEHTPPRQEDKRALLEKAFQEAKTMNQEGRTLEDIALLLSASINEVHPFADANGRTSRLVYTLLTSGYTNESQPIIKNILSEYGRDHVDINPHLITVELDNLVIAEVGLNDPKKNPHHIGNVFWMGVGREAAGFKHEIPEPLKNDFFIALRFDGTYMNLAVFSFINRHPHIEKYIKEFPRSSPNNVSIILRDLIPDLQEQDLKEIINIYWRLKKRYAELLIDSIVHPEKPEYIVQQEGSTSLLQYFKKRIKQRQSEVSR